MRPSPGRRSASPVTRRRSPSPETSPSRSPPRIKPLGRRRLWSPPPRKRTPPTTPLRWSARSAIPKAAAAPHLRSVVAPVAQRLQLPSRSRRSEHRSQYDSRPPATSSSESVDVRGNVRGRPKTMPPSSPPVLSPPPTPHLVRQRPPAARSGNRGSRLVTSTIVATAWKRARPRPPTPEDIQRVNQRLRNLVL